MAGVGGGEAERNEEERGGAPRTRPGKEQSRVQVRTVPPRFPWVCGQPPATAQCGGQERDGGTYRGKGDRDRGAGSNGS